MSMDMRQRLEPPARPWVDWFAGRIHDPVVRLRFLKAVAPPPETRSAGARSLRPVWLLALLLTILLSFFLVRAIAKGGPVRDAPRTAAPMRRAPAPAPVASRPPEVWQVEQNGESESYSNGLRIDNRFSVSGRARSYRVFAVSGGSRGELRTVPAGIVFHATESRQAPFEAGQNGVLKRIGESLLEYVQRRRAYHFLIDRFGRVYRIVNESDAANHAGYSVWSDRQWLYLNLNDSFLGVAIEAQTESGLAQGEVSPAQVRSAAMLTEMLRARFGIPAANCVTHAQVSVNPSNMRVGYHTDWASGFPFEQLGLPDNYGQALPALWAFGFECDAGFLRSAGGRMQPGVESAEQAFLARAAAVHLTPAAYRKLLQRQYHECLAEARHSAAGFPN